MASLTAHLLEAGDHGRLGFHSRCPVCRQERLVGPLSSEPVITRKAQAALAGGVLALSAASPAAVFAQEPDRQIEGIVAPLGSESGSNDSASSGGTDSLGESGRPQPNTSPGAGEAPGHTESPDFDPGGDTPLPYEVAPLAAPVAAPPVADRDVGTGTDPEDLVLLDSEPVDDPDARLVPPSEPELQVPPNESSVMVPPGEGELGAPPAGATPTPVAPAPPAPPAAVGQPSDAKDSNQAEGDRRHQVERGSTSPQAKPHRGARSRQDSTQPPASTIGGGLGLFSPASTSPPETMVPVGRHGTAEAASASTAQVDPDREKDRRIHVVQPGDTLWSIAKDLLGRDASVAQVAREVNRLWALNDERIGTGSPDLLMVGTKLRLR